MIFVDRNTVPIPPILTSPQAERARQNARDYFRKPFHSRAQQRFDFNHRIWSVVRPLTQLFHGKCAFCETPIEPSASAEINHFRPRLEPLGEKDRSIAMRRKKGSNRDGYWWLAYEWSNLYLACPLCAYNKRNFFPIVGARAKPETYGEKLLTEKALLIDPCRDNPLEYFAYRADGTIVPRVANHPGFRGYDRAKVTISILGLNREPLLVSRGEAMRQTDAFLEEWWRKGRVVDRDRLEQWLHPGMSFIGARLQVVREHLARRGAVEDLSIMEIDHKSPRTNRGMTQNSRRKTPANNLAKLEIEKAPRHRRKSRVSAPKRLAPAQATGSIASIYIKDFKAIRELETNLPMNGATPVGDETPWHGWKVILGENGSGKSSVLQAITFALMGGDYVKKHLKEHKLEPSSLLRQIRGRRRVKSARVEITFTTGRKIVMKIDAKAVTFPKPPPQNLFVRAYGATRLMPRRNVPTPRVKKGVYRSASNLFSPHRPLLNVNRWLVTLKRPEFNNAARSLKDLLGLPEEPNLSVEGRHVIVPVHGLRHPIEELSAGYESILVMSADIMAGVMGTLTDFRQATGIVLLDEIDAHLHPRWKMRIVEKLRRTFPAMQFIVTTHEPLCLRGVGESETLVVRREEGEVVCLDNLPSPSELRVDQLLTSDLFGLHTTIDPELDEQFTEYYTLLGRDPKGLTAADRHRLGKLRRALPPVRMIQLIGDNRREQLIYEVADRYLASELIHRDTRSQLKFRNEMATMREDVRREIAKIWEGGDGR